MYFRPLLLQCWWCNYMSRMSLRERDAFALQPKKKWLALKHFVAVHESLVEWDMLPFWWSALMTRCTMNEKTFTTHDWMNVVRARKWLIFIKVEVSNINPSSISVWILGLPPYTAQIRLFHNTRSIVSVARRESTRFVHFNVSTSTTRKQQSEKGKVRKGVRRKETSQVFQSFSACFRLLMWQIMHHNHVNALHSTSIFIFFLHQRRDWGSLTVDTDVARR